MLPGKWNYLSMKLKGSERGEVDEVLAILGYTTPKMTYPEVKHQAGDSWPTVTI